jgi:hypothetical protein
MHAQPTERVQGVNEGVESGVVDFGQRPQPGLARMAWRCRLRADMGKGLGFRVKGFGFGV